MHWSWCSVSNFLLPSSLESPFVRMSRLMFNRRAASVSTLNTSIPAGRTLDSAKDKSRTDGMKTRTRGRGSENANGSGARRLLSLGLVMLLTHASKLGESSEMIEPLRKAARRAVTLDEQPSGIRGAGQPNGGSRRVASTRQAPSMLGGGGALIPSHTLKYASSSSSSSLVVNKVVFQGSPPRDLITRPTVPRDSSHTFACEVAHVIFLCRRAVRFEILSEPTAWTALRRLRRGDLGHPAPPK